MSCDMSFENYFSLILYRELEPWPPPFINTPLWLKRIIAGPPTLYTPNITTEDNTLTLSFWYAD